MLKCLLLMLVVTVACGQSFNYYNASMQNTSGVPKVITEADSQPPYVCTLLNTSTVRLYKLNTNGYTLNQTINLMTTVLFCNFSTDGSTAFILITGSTLKVYTRSSSTANYTVYSTLTSFNSSSQRIETNANGSLFATIYGTGVYVWRRNTSLNLKYSLTANLNVGTFLSDLRLLPNDNMVALVSSGSAKLVFMQYNTTSKWYSMPQNISLLSSLVKLQASTDGSLVLAAYNYGVFDLFYKDPSTFLYGQLTQMSTYIQPYMLKLTADGSAFVNVGAATGRTEFYSQNQNNSYNTDSNQSLANNCIWYYTQCLFNCSADANSLSTSVYATCSCQSNFTWNGSVCSRRCDLDAHSTGPNTQDSTICDCTSGYSFNTTNGMCLAVTTTTPSNTLAIALGVSISLVIATSIGVGVGVWYYRKRRQIVGRAPQHIPYLVPRTEHNLPPPGRGEENITSLVLPGPRRPPSEMLVCSVCLMEGPDVLTSCGHRFHRPCIQSWLARSGTCPNCRRSRINYR